MFSFFSFLLFKTKTIIVIINMDFLSGTFFFLLYDVFLCRLPGIRVLEIRTLLYADEIKSV